MQQSILRVCKVNIASALFRFAGVNFFNLYTSLAFTRGFLANTLRWLTVEIFLTMYFIMSSTDNTCCIPLFRPHWWGSIMTGSTLFLCWTVKDGSMYSLVLGNTATYGHLSMSQYICLSPNKFPFLTICLFHICAIWLRWTTVGGFHSTLRRRMQTYLRC